MRLTRRTCSTVLKSLLSTLAATLLLAAPAGAGQVYVTGSTGDAISPFSIGSGGALTPIACPGSSCQTASQPIGVAISPNGLYLYAANHGSSRVTPYSLAAGGAMTPVSCPGSNCNTGTNPYGIAVSPSGQFVYTANLGADTVSPFSVGANGSLTPIACPGSSCNTGLDPYGVAVTPNGQYLYTANRASQTVSPFFIGANGALTPIACPGSNCNTGTQPQAVAVSPNGNFLYVANRGSARVSVYAIAANGTLTPVTCTTNCNTGAAPMWMAISPDGQRLYTVNRTAQTVSAFAVNAGGTLTPIACGSNCNTGPTPGGIAVSSDGRYVYVSNFGSNRVSPYTINANGSLTPIGCSAPNCNTASGPDFQSVAVRPAQPPTASYGFVTKKPGQATTFDGSASTAVAGQSVVRYDWDFGDGQTLPDGGPTPTHTYAAEGHYTVRLTVTDSAGCSANLTYTGQTASCNGGPTATTTQTVSVGDPPATTITSPRIRVRDDATPTFTFQAGEPGSTFECSIDTGTPSFGPCSGPGGSHTTSSPLANGFYAFRVRATDPLGFTGLPALEMFRVDTVADPDTCPALSPWLQAKRAARTARRHGGGTQEGVRAKLIVDEPSRLQIKAKLRYRHEGLWRSGDLGSHELRSAGARNLRLALPGSLAAKLKRGEAVTLKLRVTARPDSAPGCGDPPVEWLTLRTRVVGVRDAD